MMLKPSIDTLLDKVPSKYSLVILEAKRARIESGAASLKNSNQLNQHYKRLKKLSPET